MAKTIETKTETAGPEILPLPVRSAHIERVGMSYKEVIIHLPEDFQFSWINEKPELFRLIQKDRSRALAEYDRVELRARDYTIFASINHADEGKVFFFDVRRVSKPQRDVALFSDNLFEVKWASSGGGYAYYRKLDGVKMSSGAYPTPEAARAALIREQYPVTR